MRVEEAIVESDKDEYDKETIRMLAYSYTFQVKIGSHVSPLQR